MNSCGNRTFTRTVKPFGATVEITSNDRRALSAFTPAVARMSLDAGALGRFSIAITLRDDGPDDPQWPITALTTDLGGITLRCGSAVLRVDHASGHADINAPMSFLRVDDALRCFVEGAVSSLLIAAGQIHALHSALVTTAGKGLVLRGQSGAGKSTLTYACMRAGFGIASDDWVYAIADQPAERLFGYPWRIFLVEDTVRFFPELTEIAPVHHPGADLFKLAIIPPVRQRRVSSRADAVVFLEPGPTLRCDTIDAAEAQQRLLDSALPTERRDLPPAWIAELVDRPCFVLQRGTHPAGAATELQRLAKSLR